MNLHSLQDSSQCRHREYKRAHEVKDKKSLWLLPASMKEKKESENKEHRKRL